MDSLFSHIVRKRLSGEVENVATEAMAFILRSSDEAREGFLDLLERHAKRQQSNRHTNLNQS